MEEDYYYHYPVPLSRNLGTLTFWNPLDNSRPVNWSVLPFTSYTFSDGLGQKGMRTRCYELCLPHSPALVQTVLGSVLH